MFVNNRSAYSRINIEFRILLSTRKFFLAKILGYKPNPLPWREFTCSQFNLLEKSLGLQANKYMHLFVFITDGKRLTSNQVSCLKICKICFSSMLYETTLDQGLLFEAKGFLMPPCLVMVR